VSPRGAPFTTAMILICWLVFVLDWLSPHTNGFGALMIAGAIIPNAVLQGQWYRLITSGFLHFNLMHILFNSYALFQAGVFVEYVYGSSRYALIYIAALVGGGIAAYVTTIGTMLVTAGASGAIVGVFGAMAVLAFKLPPLRRELFQAAILPIALTLGYGFFNQGISNAGHIGGLIIGVVAAALITPARGRDMVRQLTLGSTSTQDPSER
jgi:membrane associated rhomboid family serine protease